MKTPRSLISRLLLLAALVWPAWAFAQAAPNLPPLGAYSEKGADTCLECHDDETATYSGSALFKGKHAHRRDARAPFGPGGLQCESCHGPGARHSAKGSNKKATINSLKADSDRPVAERNDGTMLVPSIGICATPFTTAGASRPSSSSTVGVMSITSTN